MKWQYHVPLLALALFFSLPVATTYADTIINTNDMGATSTLNLIQTVRNEAVQWFGVADDVIFDTVGIYGAWGPQEGDTATLKAYLYRQSGTTTDIIATVQSSITEHELTATTSPGTYYEFIFPPTELRSATTYGIGIEIIWNDPSTSSTFGLGARYGGDIGVNGTKSYITAYEDREYAAYYSPYFTDIHIQSGTGIVDGEYIVTFAPCSTDTRDNSQCERTEDFAEFMTYDANINTVEPYRKLEVFIENTTGQILDSFAYYYDEAGYYNINTELAILYGSSTNAVYIIRSCLLPADAFALFTPGNACTTMVYGNGTTTEGYISWWSQRNPNATSSALSAYEELTCGDLSITEVGKAFRCALLWAFEPSQTSLDKFGRTKDVIMHTYPLGYATIMWTDVASSLNSTSTSAMDKAIDVGRIFGQPGATVTVAFLDLTKYMTMGQPIFDIIETIMWIFFLLWFFNWAFSRNMRE